MNAGSVTIKLRFGLLLGAAALVSAPAWAQTPDQMRAVCKDPSLQQKMLAQVEGIERTALEWDIEASCATINMPATPVHDAADASHAASHSDWVFDARYSRDGRTIISASRDGTVRVWDVETGKPIRRIDVTDKPPSKDPDLKGIVRSVSFVGDGARAAAASDGNPVRLLELASGKIIANFPVVSDGFGGTIAATSSGVLFIGGYKEIVDAIDANTQAVRYRLPGHQMEASAIAVAETAGLVATAASSSYAKPEAKLNPRVYIWRLNSGEKLAEFEPAGDSRPGPLAFSRDGAQLAIVSSRRVYIYSVADNLITQTIMFPGSSSPLSVA
ncbi:MAG: WD40 repeat domain-containing protein, partial [Xanthobacteraceae bacterium]